MQCFPLSSKICYCLLVFRYVLYFFLSFLYFSSFLIFTFLLPNSAPLFFLPNLFLLACFLRFIFYPLPSLQFAPPLRLFLSISPYLFLVSISSSSYFLPSFSFFVFFSSLPLRCDFSDITFFPFSFLPFSIPTVIFISYLGNPSQYFFFVSLCSRFPTLLLSLPSISAFPSLLPLFFAPCSLPSFLLSHILIFSIRHSPHSVSSFNFSAFLLLLIFFLPSYLYVLSNFSLLVFPPHLIFLVFSRFDRYGLLSSYPRFSFAVYHSYPSYPFHFNFLL